MHSVPGRRVTTISEGLSLTTIVGCTCQIRPLKIPLQATTSPGFHIFMFLRAAMRFVQQIRGHIEEDAPAKQDELLRAGLTGAGLSSRYHIYVDVPTLRLRSAPSTNTQ